MAEPAKDKRSESSPLQVTRHNAESVFTDPETSTAIQVIRNLPSEISDREVLILMLAVHCSPDAVALAIDPPTTGKEVRSIIYQYRPYFEELKRYADNVLRCLLEDSMMITLARVRTGLMKAPVKSTNDVRSFMGVYMLLREVWSDMPIGDAGRSPEQGIKRLEQAQAKINNIVKDAENIKEGSEE